MNILMRKVLLMVCVFSSCLLAQAKLPSVSEKIVLDSLVVRAQYLDSVVLSESDKLDFVAAERSSKEAVGCRRKLNAIAPTHLADLANSLLQLANIQSRLIKYGEAESSLNESLQMYVGLAKLDSMMYVYSVMSVLNNLGGLHVDMGKNDLAEKELLAAKLKYDRLELAQKDRAFEAAILMNLSNVYRNTNKLAESETHINTVLSIFKELASTDPQEYNLRLAQTYYNLANLQAELKQFARADTNNLRALELFTLLDKNQPFMYYNELSMLYWQAAKIQLSLGSGAAAEKNLLVVLHLWQNYQKAYPNSIDYLLGMCEATEELADYYAEDKNRLKAVEYYRLAIKYRLLKDKEFPSNDSKSLARLYGNLAYHELFVKSFVLAEVSARRALDLDSSQQWIITNLAPALLFQGKYEAAEALYKEYIGKSYVDVIPKEFVVSFKIDLDRLEQAGVTHPDVVKIRKLFRN